MLFLYRRVTNSLLDLGQIQSNVTAASVNNTTPGEWYVCFIYYIYYIFLSGSYIAPTNITGAQSPHDAIQGIIKYYVLIGFLSIFFYWVAWSSWIIAAERQVRRIRCVLVCNE
jgi:hypothetical protein